MDGSGTDNNKSGIDRNPLLNVVEGGLSGQDDWNHADILAGTHSRHSKHSLAAMDENAKSRFLASSNFSKRFTFVNPNNSAQLSTFLLLNSMIGSGILNQPYVFNDSGILGAFVGFIVATIATWTGLLCLTAAGIEEDVWEYSGLAKVAFQGNGERVVDIAIIIMTFGSQLGYILVVGSTVSDLLSTWGCQAEVCSEIYTTIISIALFVTPTCLFRHFGHLAYISVFSVAAIVAVLLLVIIGGPIKHSLAEHPDNDYKIFNVTGMLASLGSIVFSLDCASSNFQAFVSTEPEAQTLSSWSAITRNAVFGGAIMCAIMGVVGYLSFGSSTQGMILDNFHSSGYDVFKVLVTVHLILYIPSNFVIMRYSIVKLFSGQRSELLASSTHTLLTVLLLTVCVGVVLALMSLGLSSGVAFSLILNITGGIGGMRCVASLLAII